MAVASAPVEPRLRGSSIGWIHRALTDIAVAGAWVPFAVGAMVVPAPALRWYAFGVLVLSLAHQPVTLAVVYADGEQLAARRRLFTWAPVVLAAAVFVGLHISFMLVAVIGALWNTEHTLMQRYGLVRIYRRKVGDPGSGHLDLALLVSWLALVLAWAVADPRTPERIDSLGLGTANERSLELLVDARPYASALLVVTAVSAVIVTGRWWRRERRHGFAANPAVYLYLAATGALFALALAHPVAGLLAWIGSHAVEYFVVVIRSLAARHPPGARSRTWLARGVRGPLGVGGVVAGSALLGTAVVLIAQLHAGLLLYGMIFFCVGGLHIVYDGVIWKLRRPAVADSFAIDR